MYYVFDPTRRSENDSTLSLPRSENANIAWAWQFQIVILFMVHCIMPPNFRQWCDFLTFPNMSHHTSDLAKHIMENFKVLCEQTLAVHDYFEDDLFNGTVHHLTKVQADNRNPLITRAVGSFGTERWTDGRTDGRTHGTIPVGANGGRG